VVVLLLAVPLWRGANMPNWNGLGYQQLAQTRLSQKADRSQQGWMKFVDTMNKYFETQGAQQYQTGRDATQQKYSLESLATEFGYGQQQAATRQGYDVENAKTARDFSATEDAKYRMPVGTQLSESAKDRAMQGQGKATPAKILLDYLSNASYMSGIGFGANGFSGFASLTDDETGKRSAKISALRQAFIEDTAGDPNQEKLLASFDRMARDGDAGAAADDLTKKAGASKDAATKLVNMIKTNPLVGGIAEAVLAIFTTTKGGANVSAAKDWLNNWFPGRLGDKLFPIIGTASDPNRTFGITPQKEPPASGQIPNRYRPGG
jgi:hypothetical protein